MKIYCPTCQKLEDVTISGEMTFTLACGHTRPKAIPTKATSLPDPELPNFAKWYMHNIDRDGLGKTAAELKVTEQEMTGSIFVDQLSTDTLKWKTRQEAKAMATTQIKSTFQSVEQLIDINDKRG